MKTFLRSSIFVLSFICCLEPAPTPGVATAAPAEMTSTKTPPSPPLRKMRCPPANAHRRTSMPELHSVPTPAPIRQTPLRPVRAAIASEPAKIWQSRSSAGAFPEPRWSQSYPSILSHRPPLACVTGIRQNQFPVLRACKPFGDNAFRWSCIQLFRVLQSPCGRGEASLAT